MTGLTEEVFRYIAIWMANKIGNWSNVSIASSLPGNHPPGIPANFYPENGVIVGGTNVNLSWDSSDTDGDTVTYDLYFGTINPPAFIGSTSQKSYSLNGLKASTVYYWQFIAKDSKGGISEVPVRQFSTTSKIIVYPNPYKPNSRLGHQRIVFSGLTTKAKIVISSLTGEKVREIDNENSEGSFLWDARNDNGERLASGIYLYLVTGENGGKKTGKIAIIK